MPHPLTPPNPGGESTNGDPRIFVSVKEAAEMLALSAWEVYQLCGSGTLESGKHGKRRLVLLESVRAYAASILAGDGS
jgi:excisionase family DNA binding protein